LEKLEKGANFTKIYREKVEFPSLKVSEFERKKTMASTTETVSIRTTPCDPASTKVALLKGGTSGEREISLASGAAAAEALRAGGFTVEEIDTKDAGFIGQLAAAKPDVVFIALHGRDGEDGTVQGVCELLGLPYTGSGVLASALAMDKIRTKVMYHFVGLPTAPWAELPVEAKDELDCDQIVSQLGEDCVVKPMCEGSALGVHLVHAKEEMAAAVEDAFTCGGGVMVEKLVAGTEVTVGVLGGAEPVALPVIEIVPQKGSGFYDFEAKYSEGGSKHVVPARIDDDVAEKCREFALVAHAALGCRDVSRTDMIVTDEGTPVLLETNTIPGMTATSLLPDAAAEVGIDFAQLCRTLVELALAH
jgi:D-alanine-D-alanine ligase